MIASPDHGGLMDRVYRRQRHVYDATRKYYLLGRDPMIEGLLPPENGHILEIGCGTGRNLVAAARRYPSANLYGVDISREMLVTAGNSVGSAGFQNRIRLALADAASFDPEKAFRRKTFDRIFISYAVSMIPQWRSVMEAAMQHLLSDGQLHVVDFGDQRDLPKPFKSALYTWLDWYHVTPRPDLFSVSSQLARAVNGEVAERRLYRGFAWISVISRSAPPAP